MSKPAVCHWEIMGKDGKKTREFYAKLFDWDIKLWGNMDYGMVEGAGQGTIGGGVGGVQPGQKPITVFYVMVDDLQAYLDRAGKLGGKTLMPPTKISDEIGSFAMFADPDGNMIGLFKNAPK